MRNPLPAALLAGPEYSYKKVQMDFAAAESFSGLDCGKLPEGSVEIGKKKPHSSDK